MKLPDIEQADEKQRERAKRVINRRIQSHDPGPKVKGVNWAPDRTKNKVQKPLILEFWDALPPRGRGAIVGVIFGLVALVPSTILLPGAYKLLGLVVFLLCILGGTLIWNLAEKD